MWATRAFRAATKRGSWSSPAHAKAACHSSSAHAVGRGGVWRLSGSAGAGLAARRFAQQCRSFSSNVRAHAAKPGSKARYRAAQRAAAEPRKKTRATKAQIWMWGAGVFVTFSCGVMGWNVYTWNHTRTSLAAAVLAKPLIEGNPLVYFDVLVDGVPAGRITMQLRADVTPITAENMRVLITEELGYGLVMSRFHDADNTDAFLAGDWMTGTGDESTSIYKGGVFDDENFELKHDGPGVLSMDNGNKPNNNGSKFAITLKAMPEWDGERVVFGNVVEGMDVLFKIADTQNLFKNTAKTRWALARSDPIDVTIRKCGQLGWIGSSGPAPLPDNLPEVVGGVAVIARSHESMVKDEQQQAEHDRLIAQVEASIKAAEAAEAAAKAEAEAAKAAKQ